MAKATTVVFIMNLIGIFYPGAWLVLGCIDGDIVAFLFTIWPVIVIILGTVGSRTKNNCCIMAHNVMLIIGLVCSVITALVGIYSISSPKWYRTTLGKGDGYQSDKDVRKTLLPGCILMLLSTAHSIPLCIFGFKARSEINQETAGPQNGMSPYGAPPAYPGYSPYGAPPVYPGYSPYGANPPPPQGGYTPYPSSAAPTGTASRASAPPTGSRSDPPSNA